MQLNAHCYQIVVVCCHGDFVPFFVSHIQYVTKVKWMGVWTADGTRSNAVACLLGMSSDVAGSDERRVRFLFQTFLSLRPNDNLLLGRR